VADTFNENGEVASVIIVKSTAVNQTAHSLEGLARRPGFRPKMLSTDTWPNKNEFFAEIFIGVKGFLGAFHFMHCIYDTLDSSAPFFYEAICDLRSAILLDNPEDLSLVHKALMDGHVGQQKKRSDPMTAKEVASFERTRMFQQRYSSNIRTIIKRPEDIKVGLEAWMTKYAKMKSRNWRLFFSMGTETAIANCILKAKDVAAVWEHLDSTAGRLATENEVYN